MGTSFILSWLLFNSHFSKQYIDLLYFAATPVFIDLGFGMSLQLTGIQTKVQKNLLQIGILLSIIFLVIIDGLSYSTWTKYLLVPILLCDYLIDRLSMNKLIIQFNLWRQFSIIMGALLCSASLFLGFTWEKMLIIYMVPRILVNSVIILMAKEHGLNKIKRFNFFLYYPGQVLFFINNQLIYFVIGFYNAQSQLLYGSSDRAANFFARPLTIFGQFYVNLSSAVKRYFQIMFLLVSALIVCYGRTLLDTIFPDMEVMPLVVMLQFISMGFLIPSSNLLFSVYKVRNYQVLSLVTLIMLLIRLVLLNDILSISMCNLFLAFFTYIYTKNVASKSKI